MAKPTDARKHLAAAEVDKLLAATKGSRNEARDRCLLLLMFRLGARAAPQLCPSPGRAKITLAQKDSDQIY